MDQGRSAHHRLTYMLFCYRVILSGVLSMYTAQAYIYVVYWLVAGLFRGFVDKGYSWGGYVLVFMF